MSARDRGGHDNTADAGARGYQPGARSALPAQVERNASRGAASPGLSHRLQRWAITSTLTLALPPYRAAQSG
jgi:hypothetical protein